jgi:hypothetical protein
MILASEGARDGTSKIALSCVIRVLPVHRSGLAEGRRCRKEGFALGKGRQGD